MLLITEIKTLATRMIALSGTKNAIVLKQKTTMFCLTLKRHLVRLLNISSYRLLRFQNVDRDFCFLMSTSLSTQRAKRITSFKKLKKLRSKRQLKAIFFKVEFQKQAKEDPKNTCNNNINIIQMNKEADTGKKKQQDQNKLL